MPSCSQFLSNLVREYFDTRGCNSPGVTTPVHMKVLNVYSEKIGRSFQEKCRMGLTEMKGDYRSVGGSTKFHRLPFRNTPSATTAIATPIGTADIDRRFKIFYSTNHICQTNRGMALAKVLTCFPLLTIIAPLSLRRHQDSGKTNRTVN
jgi:hypothetical protein